MKISRPAAKEGLLALAFFTALGIGSVLTYRVVESSRGYSTSFGGYELRADSQRADGTYVGVTVSSSAQARSTTTVAKFARRDANKPNRWVLSDGISRSYNRQGGLLSEATFQEMVFDIQ